jgi:hypothetical protein
MMKAWLVGWMLGAVIAAAGELPAGWYLAGNRPKEYETGVDSSVTSRGNACLYLKSIVAETTGFGTVMQQFDAEPYIGKRLRISAFVRAKNVTDWAGLWMRVDRVGGGSLTFDNMQDRPIKGTIDWRRCEVVLDVPETSSQVFLGILLSGSGEVWLDDLKIETVGSDVPVTQARLPKVPQNLDFEK